MSSEVGISFNMNPRWLGEEGLAAFLDPLRQAGLDTLEFELDPFLPEWPQMDLSGIRKQPSGKTG